ncbi:VanZ family protein [Bacteroidia bacterium]|nr:VanZ family protein [Bacteroidia bacterium]MDB9882877.1 VanZ family protein [Bacteroidia bacterium]MDC1395404.1 VanZ family protein [Bacteroidia bacterium]
MRLSRAYIPAGIWTAFIASSCLLPASAFNEFSFDSIFELDKLIHLTLYFVLIILWSLAIGKQSLENKKKLSLLLYVVLFGVIIEVLQSSMSLGRHYDIEDIIANTIGSIIGVLLIPFVHNKKPLIKKYLPFIDKLY